ncbi:hypothetical protein GAMM_210002 [Gammaproteobacteria bacterium]
MRLRRVGFILIFSRYNEMSTDSSRFSLKYLFFEYFYYFIHIFLNRNRFYSQRSYFFK